MIIPERKMDGAHPSRRTSSKFILRDGSRPIRHLDISDMQQVTDGTKVQKNGGEIKGRRSKALAIPSNNSLPPHLLMASLLEQLCFLMEPNRTKADKLFKVLCEHLSRLKIIAPLSQLDEMKSLRLQHRANLNRIMQAAMFHLNSQSIPALESPDTSIRLNTTPMVTDIIDEQTSRYSTEFEELSCLGKGGFGSVYKARNYLDGRSYAVKKIRFKQKNAELFLKLLREVKALACLQHPNIVGYNVSWVEYDSPLFYSSTATSSSNESPRTEDSLSKSESVRDETRNSYSVEFLNSDAEDKEETVGDTNPFVVRGPMSIAMAARKFSNHKRVQIEEIRNVAHDLTSNCTVSTREFTGVKVDVKQEHVVSVSASTLPQTLERTRPDLNLDALVPTTEVLKVSGSVTEKESQLRYSSTITTTTTTTHEDCGSDTFDNISRSFSNFHSSSLNKMQATEETTTVFNERADSRLVPWQRRDDTLNLILSRLPPPSPRLLQEEEESSLNRNIDSSVSSFGFAPSAATFDDNDPFFVSGGPQRHGKYFASEKSQKSLSSSRVPNEIVNKGSFKRTSSYSGKRHTVKIVPLDDSYSDTDHMIASEKDGRSKQPQRQRHPSFHRSFSMNAATDFGGVVEVKNHDYDIQSSIILYIQMELCSNTLAEWLEDRNQNLDMTSKYKDSLCTLNMHIFNQVMEGVHYIHSQGLIHRDLKPRNIFLSDPDLRVKIGDFGLAKEGVISPGGIEDSSNIMRARSYSTASDHTSGVGTSAYAAPEQLKGPVYDVKSDIYSLGVILYEMFNVFKTGMERAQNIQNLRKGVCCPQFRKCWPHQAEAVVCMTLESPTERPSAKALLTNGLFLSAEQQVKLLKQVVAEKDKTLQEKDQQMAEKDKIIHDLRKQIKHLTSDIVL